MTRKLVDAIKVSHCKITARSGYRWTGFFIEVKAKSCLLLRRNMIKFNSTA